MIWAGPVMMWAGPVSAAAPEADLRGHDNMAH